MTKLSEIKQYSHAFGFAEQMHELGFSEGPNDLWFYRRRGDYIDVFLFWLKSSENWVSVPVTCLKYDLIDHCDMTEFPKGFASGVPIFTDSYINEEYGVEIGSDPWKVKDEKSIKITFDEIYKLFIESVDDWFKSINTDQQLFDSFSLNMKESESGMQYKEKLFS